MNATLLVSHFTFIDAVLKKEGRALSWMGVQNVRFFLFPFSHRAKVVSNIFKTIREEKVAYGTIFDVVSLISQTLEDLLCAALPFISN